MLSPKLKKTLSAGPRQEPEVYTLDDFLDQSGHQDQGKQRKRQGGGQRENEKTLKAIVGHARRLRRAGDLSGALAAYDGLPAVLGDHDGLPAVLGDHETIVCERESLLDLIRKRTVKEARHLGRAGDFRGALAVCDGLPTPLRDHPQMLQERGKLFRQLGQFDTAYDLFRRAISADPTQNKAWKRATKILGRLGRGHELAAFIDNMLAALPHTSEMLIQAASTARKGRLHSLADKLWDQALLSQPSPTAMLEAARLLLEQGEQGRAIALLQNGPAQPDAEWRSRALELNGLALARLRLAGRSSASGPVAKTERADVIAAQSILDYDNPRAGIKAAGGRIAIIANSLGPGGIQKQVVQLVRQLCSASDGFAGTICILLVGRSRTAPEFHKSELADLAVTVETIPDFDIDIRELTPARLAGQFSVLPRAIYTRAAYLIDRLTAHRPEVVLAMGENNGLIAMLAASVVGGARVVVSARGEPPPARSLHDGLLRPVYQAALARNRVALVTNSSATARHFAEWLELSRDRIGVIYNGIDVDDLLAQRDLAATAAHRRALGVRDGARIVGSVFNARREKRPELWLEAAAAIARRDPDVVFVIVGGGRWMNEVSGALERHGLEGRFHRPGIRSDVATWLELMDVFLLTSENEGTPNVLIEAQALGRPVVATAVGGNAETFIPEQTGLLLGANPTPDEIADAVMRLLGDPAFTKRARELGPAFIRRRFDVKRMAAEFVDLCFERDRD